MVADASLPLLQEHLPTARSLATSQSSAITVLVPHHPMQPQPYFPGAAMIRPSVLLRIVTNAVIAWLVLAIIWMTLPSPLVKNGPDYYVTKRLKAGKSLIRVYE